MRLFKPLTFTNVLILLHLLVFTTRAEAGKRCIMKSTDQVSMILSQVKVRGRRCERPCGFRTIGYVNRKRFCINKEIADVIQWEFNRCQRDCEGSGKFRRCSGCAVHRISLYWWGAHPSFCPLYSTNCHRKLSPAPSPTRIREDNSTTSTVMPSSESEDADIAG